MDVGNKSNCHGDRKACLCPDSARPSLHEAWYTYRNKMLAAQRRTPTANPRTNQQRMQWKANQQHKFEINHTGCTPVRISCTHARPTHSATMGKAPVVLTSLPASLPHEGVPAKPCSPTFCTPSASTTSPPSTGPGGVARMHQHRCLFHHLLCARDRQLVAALLRAFTATDGGRSEGLP